MKKGMSRLMALLLIAGAGATVLEASCGSCKKNTCKKTCKRSCNKCGKSSCGCRH